MIALDTNLIVRLLTNDEPQQAQKIVRLIDRHQVYVPKTVLLETEWVLRYAYALEPGTINVAFRKLVGLATLSVEDPIAVATAIEWRAMGLDFADALHLASSRPAQGFASFDRDLQRRTRQLRQAVEVIAP
jgi:predicted nucleic-acid-binding protein